MIDYRVHFLDEAGRVARAAGMAARDDEAARLTLVALRPLQPVEIWRGDRKIAHLETDLLARFLEN